MNAIRSLLLCILVACSTVTHASARVREWLFDPVDSARNRTVPVKVYSVPTGKPQPVVLFSHGLGGSRNNNPYLGNDWAEHGYRVVFIQHHGSDEDVWKSTAPQQRMKALKEAASVTAALDRLNDVPFVIDQLAMWNADPEHPLHGTLDLDHIGLSGHSFGAVTTLGMLPGRKSFARQTFADERIDAFLAMSPQPGKGLSPAATFGKVEVPVLCMTGTEDKSPIDPAMTPEMRREVYAAFPPGDKYQLVFEGGHHFTFGEDKGRLPRERNPKHHPAILQISTHFWDAYLKGDESAKAWLQSETPRKDCDLDAMDVWEWK